MRAKGEPPVEDDTVIKLPAAPDGKIGLVRVTLREAENVQVMGRKAPMAEMLAMVTDPAFMDQV